MASTPTRTPKRPVIASMTVLTLLGSLFVAAAVVPMASAHTCQSSDPAANCGPCPSGNHRHTDNSGNVYCSSSEPDPSEPECGLKSVEQILACLKDLSAAITNLQN